MLLVFLLSAAVANDRLPSLDVAISTVERFGEASYTAEEGVVQLRGEVPTVTARDELGALAGRIDGVVFVDNQLVISSAPATAPAADDRDLAIEERLTRSFALVEELRAIDVEVQDGVVQLGGRVFDEESRSRALETAAGLEGILLVDDDMSLVDGVGERLEPAVDELLDWVRDAIAFLPVALVGLVVFLVAVLVGRLLQRTDALYGWTRDRPLLRTVIGRVVAFVAVIAGVVAALQIMGLSALASAALGTAGIAGLAVGFAFKDIVENYLSGILLGVQQLFSRNDIVEIDGTLGMVVRMSMRNTLVLTFDGNHVFLPNAMVFKSVVTNLTRNPQRRFHFQVGVGVDENLTDVLRIGTETLRAMPAVLSDPPPMFHIATLGDSNVVLDAYGWVDQRRSDFLAVRTEAIRRVKLVFDREGFDMPEPIYRIAVGPTGSGGSGGSGSGERRSAMETAEREALSLEADRTLERQAEEQRAHDAEEDLL